MTRWGAPVGGEGEGALYRGSRFLRVTAAALRVRTATRRRLSATHDAGDGMKVLVTVEAR